MMRSGTVISNIILIILNQIFNMKPDIKEKITGILIITIICIIMYFMVEF